MSFRRRIYYIILITVTAACVLAGLAWNVLGIGKKGRNLFGLSETVAETSETDETGTGSIHAELDRFLSVDIQVSAANIALEYGDGYSLSCTYQKDMQPAFEVSNNVLKITQKNATQEHVLGVRDTDCMITLTVPQSAYVSNAAIQLDIGSVSVRDISVHSYSIVVNAGSISTENTSMSSGDFEVETGNITMNNVQFDTMDLSSGSGDISLTIPERLVSCGMKLSTGLGDVRVFGTSHYTQYETSQGGSASITARCETGNVTIDKVSSKTSQ